MLYSCLDKIKSNVNDLQNKLNEIKESIDKQPNALDVNLINEKENIQKEIDSFLEQKSRGAFIRSRAQWCEEGEKCSNYFISLEKQRQTNNTINKSKVLMVLL